MDLLKLNLSIPEEILINDKYKFQLNTSKGILKDYTVHTSEDPNLIIIDGEDLSGRFSEDNDFDINNIQIYVHDERKDISFINVNSFNTNKTNLLQETLNENYGEPDYFNSEVSMSHSVWEDKATNNIILFTHKYKGKINNIAVERGTFYKMDMANEEIMTAFSRGPLSFYKAYIDYREDKNKDENYTFKMFADELNQRGVDRYLKAIQNPVKH